MIRIKKICPICNGKIKIDEWSSHVSKCYQFGKDSTLLKLPDEGSTMKFKYFKNMMERPYIVYADTECTLCENHDDEKVSIHKPNSACFYLVCTYDHSKNKLWHHVGEDCITKMILELNTTAKQCIEDRKSVV